MIYFDEYNNPFTISSLPEKDGDIKAEHIWVLDLELMDYVLAPIRVLEEVTSPVVTLSANSFKFTIPTFWNILVADGDSMMMDVIDVGSLPTMLGSSIKAVVYGHNSNKIELVDVSIEDYSPNDVDVSVSTERKHVICHPIDEDRWIHITPSDIYNKYIKGHSTGSLL